MRSTDTYNTIASESEALYKEKGSKFIALAFPAILEEQAKEILSSVRKQYHDARHHCYAYRLGNEEPFQYRMNDDGEPSGTAGKPIYGQILSKNLTNILVVVVRYFGGTLLGTGGLIRAYKNATRECLEQADIIQRKNILMLKIDFPYESMNQVMRLVKDEMLNIAGQTSGYTCQVILQVPKSQYNRVKARFLKLENTRLIE